MNRNYKGNYPQNRYNRGKPPVHTKKMRNNVIKRKKFIILLIIGAIGLYTAFAIIRNQLDLRNNEVYAREGVDKFMIEYGRQQDEIVSRDRGGQIEEGEGIGAFEGGGVERYAANRENNYVLTSWKTILVNRYNPIPEGHQMNLQEVENGFFVDARIVDALQEMLATMRADGLSPLIVSAHRNNAVQTMLFESNVERLESEGWSRAAAEQETARKIAIPGTSEHEIGLAIDFGTAQYRYASVCFGETPEGRWLAEHSAEFGFILRYPRGTEQITGVIFEPWHFRYVGVEAARFITENQLTLEEYVQLFE